MGVISRGIKNAFRNNVRTVGITLILGLSVGLAISMVVARGAVNDKINSVKGSIGNIINISPAGANGFQGGGEPLAVDQISKVKTLPHVTAVNETLRDRLDSTSTNLQSTISAGSLGRRFRTNPSAGNSSSVSQNFTPPIIVTGTDNPMGVQVVTGGNTLNITSGKVFDGSSTANVAVLGKDIATKNNLAVGGTFQAYGTTITVVAIYDAGTTFANNSVIMPLATVQTLSAQVGSVTSAVAQVDSITSLNSVVASIKTTLGTTADVVSQQDTSAQAVAPLENIKKVSLYSLVAAVSAGGVVIFMTMLMIVRERRREIGVLKAIGASNLKVIGQFITESVTLTVLGAIVGLGIGVASAGPLTRALVSNATSTATNAVGQGGRGGGFLSVSGGNLRFGSINAVIDWHILVYGFVTAIAIAIIGSSAAAFLTSKIRPSEVMRTE